MTHQPERERERALERRTFCFLRDARTQIINVDDADTNADTKLVLSILTQILTIVLNQIHDKNRKNV